MSNAIVQELCSAAIYQVIQKVCFKKHLLGILKITLNYGPVLTESKKKKAQLLNVTVYSHTYTFKISHLLTIIMGK